jgi:hypothetical protein
MILKKSRFFKNIDPYALVIMATNLEVRTFKFGEVIVRQGNTHFLIIILLGEYPSNFFIIANGECKTVYENIVLRPRKASQYCRKSVQKIPQRLKFGLRKYEDPLTLENDKNNSLLMNYPTSKMKELQNQSFENEVVEEYWKESNKKGKQLEKTNTLRTQHSRDTNIEREKEKEKDHEGKEGKKNSDKYIAYKNHVKLIKLIN